jgi:hypothetical protein
MTSCATSKRNTTEIQAHRARNAVMETLNRLYLEFAAMGKLDEAAPQLEELMKVAYGDLPERITSSEEYRRNAKAFVSKEDSRVVPGVLTDKIPTSLSPSARRTTLL